MMWMMFEGIYKILNAHASCADLVDGCEEGETVGNGRAD